MKQGMKMAKETETEDKSEMPKGLKGGLAGALAGLLAASPSVSKAYRAVPMKPPANIPSHLYDLRRSEFHGSLAKALGASLAGAALGVGTEHLGKHLAKVLQEMREKRPQEG
jgi:hypothetical protein